MIPMMMKLMIRDSGPPLLKALPELTDKLAPMEPPMAITCMWRSFKLLFRLLDQAQRPQPLATPDRGRRSPDRSHTSRYRCGPSWRLWMSWGWSRLKQGSECLCSSALVVTCLCNLQSSSLFLKTSMFHRTLSQEWQLPFGGVEGGKVRDAIATRALRDGRGSS